MKKLFLIILFLLVGCGTNSETPAIGKFQGLKQKFFMQNPPQKSQSQKTPSAQPQKPVLNPGALPPIRPVNGQVPPGYVCNGDYCIEEPSKAWQDAHPDRDAMGFRKNIRAIPYDCRANGDCPEEK